MQRRKSSAGDKSWVSSSPTSFPALVVFVGSGLGESVKVKV